VSQSFVPWAFLYFSAVTVDAIYLE
jgi:hypothetical protein